MRFDFLAQFIASRGYGVLRPQFRGSDGYGTAFEHAGYGQWGGLMQDDVTDGTKWLIAQHLADPNHICIVGWSYGGYAALMGAVKEPSLYRCAASMAGVSDIVKLVRDDRKYYFHDLNIPRIVGDGTLQDQISPAYRASEIRIPILLVHGRKDYTVPVEQTEHMEAALKSAGKQVQAIYLDGADHYLSHQEDRLAFLKALEGFLAANLGTSG